MNKNAEQIPVPEEVTDDISSLTETPKRGRHKKDTPRSAVKPGDIRKERDRLAKAVKDAEKAREAFNKRGLVKAHLDYCRGRVDAEIDNYSDLDWLSANKLSVSNAKKARAIWQFAMSIFSGDDLASAVESCHAKT